MGENHNLNLITKHDFYIQIEYKIIHINMKCLFDDVLN